MHGATVPRRPHHRLVRTCGRERFASQLLCMALAWELQRHCQHDRSRRLPLCIGASVLTFKGRRRGMNWASFKWTRERKGDCGPRSIDESAVFVVLHFSFLPPMSINTSLAKSAITSSCHHVHSNYSPLHPPLSVCRGEEKRNKK